MRQELTSLLNECDKWTYSNGWFHFYSLHSAFFNEKISIEEKEYRRYAGIIGSIEEFTEAINSDFYDKNVDEDGQYFYTCEKIT